MFFLIYWGLLGVRQSPPLVAAPSGVLFLFVASTVKRRPNFFSGLGSGVFQACRGTRRPEIGVTGIVFDFLPEDHHLVIDQRVGIPRSSLLAHRS